MKKYDCIVIGGGIGGCQFAERASKAGYKCAIVEKNKLGGTCLHSGCIPSKSYLSVANLLQKQKTLLQNEVLDKQAEVCFSKLYLQQKSIVHALQEGMRDSLLNAGVDIYMAEALFKSKEDKIVQVNEEVLQGERIVLAIGSKPRIPDIEGLEEEIKSEIVVTSDSLFDIDMLPENLVIVGGGVSGVEIAYAFASFGSKVTLIESFDCILHNFSDEVSLTASKILKNAGVSIITGSHITSICEGTVVYEDNKGAEQIIDTDIVYLSVGREVPETEILSGLKRTKNEFVWTSDSFETSQKDIYAIGDMIGGYMLAHEAMMQADNLLDFIQDKKEENRCKSIIRSVYISPEIAQVGYSENELKDKGIPYNSHKISMNYSGRYVAIQGEMNSTGWLRIFFDSNDVMIGATMSSTYAAEIAMTLQVLIQNQADCRKVLEMNFAHPTESEIIKKCVEEYLTLKGM